MRLTTKSRYAVTALLDVAIHSTSGPISLPEISERQEISISYLEQIFSKLRKANLVASVRGPGGGYIVEQPLDKISVAGIIAAVNESIDNTSCNGKGNCKGGQRCITHDLWADLSAQIHDFLSSITMAQLVSRLEARSHHSASLTSDADRDSLNRLLIASS